MEHQTKELQLKQAREMQLEFECTQLELKLEYEKKSSDVVTSKEHVKLPKLEITKFSGEYDAWLPFWNKFKVEIDSSKLPAVTKFAYLKELLEPKIRVEVEGLPFTPEGYQNAIEILEKEYRQTSEIVNIYIHNILSLPVVTSANPKKINEFYKKLLYHIQSLSTLGKLDDVKGNVRGVLDKLKGIKADLVRGKDGWQNWHFPQLIEALKHWQDIYPIEVSEPPWRLPSCMYQNKQGNRRPNHAFITLSIKRAGNARMSIVMNRRSQFV